MLLSSSNLDTKTIADKYILLKNKQIGSGAFAIVYEGYAKGNPQQKVAIKVLQTLPTNQSNEKIEKMKETYKRERETQQKIQSDNVVKMIDVIQCEQSTYLILEYCEEGNLNKLLNRQKKRQLSQERAYQILCQIIQGYKSLYHCNTLHRDLKPENILFSKGVAKIADFGLAKMIEDIDLPIDQTKVGTTLYQAPEVMVCSKYSSKVDIWSLGVIFYEMLYGVVPFMENNDVQLHKKITSEELKFPKEVEINDFYISLIKKLLTVDPEKRIRWDQLFSLLQKDLIQQPLLNDNISQASTHMSESDKFQSDYKKVEQQINKIDEIKEYFDYISGLISFFNNNTTRQFFALYKQQILQISPTKQILFSVTSTKYLLNFYNFCIQILQGKISPTEINFKQNDIETFKTDQVKYYPLLSQFKTNQEKMNTFYNDQLLPQFKKLKQGDQTNSLIQVVDEIIQIDQVNNKFKDNFNKIYMHLINEIYNSTKKKQITDEASQRQIYTLLINMYFSLHPQKFTFNGFEPKNLEKDIVQSTTQQLENKVFQLNINYSALIK